MGAPLRPGIRLLANRGDVGGGEVMLLRLAQALRDLGRAVTIVAPASPGEAAELLAAAGFEVERIPATSRRGYLLGLRRWTGGHGDLLWCNGLLPAVALSGRARRVVHLHQLPDGRRQRALAGIARRGALATLVPSGWMAARVPGSSALENWVPGPADASAPGWDAHGRSEGPRRVGFLGRLSADKGFLDLLRAAELIEDRRPGSIRLHVAGDDRFVRRTQAREVARAVETAGGRLRMLGWVPREQLLGEVDLLAVPSAAPESFGLVAAEAMAARVPVLVSDAGALPEVVGPDHPLVFRAGDPESLAQAIERAAALDPGALVERQHRRWAQRWSPEAGRRRLQDLLDERGL